MTIFPCLLSQSANIKDQTLVNQSDAYGDTEKHSDLPTHTETFSLRRAESENKNKNMFIYCSFKQKLPTSALTSLSFIFIAVAVIDKNLTDSQLANHVNLSPVTSLSQCCMSDI